MLSSMLNKVVLGLAAIGCLTSVTACAETSTKNWLAETQFLHPLAETKSQGYIAVSETLGVALLDKQRQVLAHLPMPAEHLDVRPLANSKGQSVFVTMDVNTGELLIIAADTEHGTLKVQQKYKPGALAFDAMCLAANKSGVELFAIDVLGTAHHLSVYRNVGQDWQVIDVNSFPVGPNVKSCAVDDTTGSLFITEENIGVWRYSTNPEHEVMRELIALPRGLEVEFVDTSSTGDVAIVSPDVNKVWFYDTESAQLTSETIKDVEAPKTIQISRSGNQLNLNMYDDEQQTLITKQFNKAQPNSSAAAGFSPDSEFSAFAQTESVQAYGDAADDPAIWVNKNNPEQSLVYTTDKKYGLNVYDLKGKLVFTLEVGRINNVDIRYGVKFANQVVDIATASNRTTNSISVFAIDTNSGIPTRLNDVATDLTDPYGLCMSKHGGEVSVWINDTNGRFQQYQLQFAGGKVSGQKTQEWLVPSQPEGCIVDEASNRLFYGEEAKGVWLKQLGTDTTDTLITGLNDEVEADIEGMGLYLYQGKNYLVVSSQGNNRFGVYAVDDGHRFIGTFNIEANWQQQIDGASETDGLELINTYLGNGLEHGLLVVQDGHNVMPKAPQNFKLVSGNLLKEWLDKRLAN